MIPWFQCTVFELKAIVRLPAALRTRVIEAREHQLARELDVLPGFTDDELSDLERRGVQTNLRSLCPRLLSDRERQSRTKTKTPENLSREPHVTLTTDERDSHAQRREEKSREEKTREEEKDVARPPRKPRQPSKGKLALAEFNAAVTAVTGSPSCVTGMANETRAAAFADAIAAAGETMTDAVRRRHGLGKSLTLHWMMNDYAGDRVAKRAVNTGNNLRQPHPRSIPTDPDEARKYWLGEETNEPRYDFG